MAAVRRTDKDQRKWFRSSRYFQEAGNWYFYTREGTMEGPFGRLEHAEERLAEYIKIMNSGFMPPDSTLKVEPKPQVRRSPGEEVS